MLLSIVIPTKDRPEYLQKILGSLYEQRQQEYDIEVIVIDDYSNKKNIARNRKISQSNQAILIEHEKSQGSGAARNSGIKNAKGEWIAFLDDDVIPNQNWLKNVIKNIKSISDNNIGIEGKVVCRGNGLWDREVENLKGNLYLTANIIYKKEYILQAGLFDKAFLKYGEDQEFALRIKKLGKINFDPSIEVSHLPRDINFKILILDSFNRIKSLLQSEYLLYQKHPENYCTIRHADTFWGTLKNSVIKHSLISIRRRSFKNYLSHPFQSLYLFISVILEHFAVLLFAPTFIIEELIKTAKIPISVNISKTASLNKLTNSAALNLLHKSESLKDKVIRIVAGKRNYKHFYNQLNTYSKRVQPNILLRIDDIFLNNEKAITQLCNILSNKKTPFLAAITLNDLKDSSNTNLIKTIENSGGTVAIHGVSHEGKHGPFPSELLQMDNNDLLKILKKNDIIKSKFFIPPFNAITWSQIETLSKGFPVICGGPETGRFTQHISLPAVLNNNTIYIPSLPPYYNSSANILKNEKCLTINGLLPITLHLSIEKSDNFNSLNILIEKYRKQFLNWESLVMEITDG